LFHYLTASFFKLGVDAVVYQYCNASSSIEESS